MVYGKLQVSGLTVQSIRETIVKASNNVQSISETIVKASNNQNARSYILPVSNQDRLTDGLPVLFFYAYPKPPSGDLSSVLNTIMTSLWQALDHFFPFSGQIIHSSKNGEAEILCNNEGVRFIEASADVSLAQLNFYNLNSTLRSLLIPIDDKFPISVQVTSYTCGGFSISWTFNHLIADAYGFVKFLSAWCEIARTKRDSKIFNHDRARVFCPRSPLVYSQVIDRTYSVVTTEEILKMPSNCATEKRLYIVKGSNLESLRVATKRTRTVALSAYLWKLMARNYNESEYRNCKIGLAVEGRQRIDRGSEAMTNFVVNVISMAIAEESTTNLKEGSLGYIAGVVSSAIDEVANREHFLDLIDWVECHRPKKMWPNVLVGCEAPGIIMSSCHNMPVMLMDFGFGLPSLGMISTPVNRISMCYVTLVSSGKGDGSWFVSAFVSPDFATAIELDPEHVFEPIIAYHLLV